MTSAQATAEKPGQKEQIAQPPKNQGAVAVFQPPRIPFHPAIEQRFGVDQSGWRALIDAVWPGAKSADAVVLALSYCKARRLDPFKRPVHIVPVWNGALQREVEGVWPGIGELRTTAFRTGFYAGCDQTMFGPDKSFSFKGRVRKPKSQDWEDQAVTITAPEWAQIVVWRLIGEHRVAFPGPRIYFLASYGRKGKTELPNDKWQQMPSYMLEKVAEAAALRKAFPEEMGEMISAEEAEGQIMDIGGGQMAEVVTPPQPKRSDFANATENATDVDEDLDGQYAATMAGRMPDTPEERGEAPESGDGQESDGAGKSDGPPKQQWITADGEVKEFDDYGSWMNFAMKILRSALDAGESVDKPWQRNAENWAAVEKSIPSGKVHQNSLARFKGDIAKVFADAKARDEA